MAESIIEIKELEKKFMGFQDKPQGDVKVAYVYFRSDDNTKFVIATEKKKVMSAELRIGKYDRIMTIRRGDFNTSFAKKIACKEDGHWFFVTLRINYYVKDPEYIFKNRAYDIEHVLGKSLSGIEFELGGNYGFREIPGFEKEIWNRINKRFAGLDFLTVTYSMEITTDENARVIVQREKQHEITSNDTDLSAIEKMAKAENEYDLEQLRLEREKESARLRAELELLKVNGYGDLFKLYGANAGLLISLANGEISGEKMSQILDKNQKEQNDGNYQKLLELYRADILTDGMAEKLIPRIILDNNQEAGEEPARIEAAKDPAGQTDSEKGDMAEEEDTSSFRWNDSEEEDGTIE